MVGAAGRGVFEPVVVMVKDHPPAKLPRSPGPSSLTYNDHEPFGEVLLNADKADA